MHVIKESLFSGLKYEWFSHVEESTGLWAQRSSGQGIFSVKFWEKIAKSVEDNTLKFVVGDEIGMELGSLEHVANVMDG